MFLRKVCVVRVRVGVVHPKSWSHISLVEQYCLFYLIPSTSGRSPLQSKTWDRSEEKFVPLSMLPMLYGTCQIELDQAGSVTVSLTADGTTENCKKAHNISLKLIFVYADQP